MKIKVSDYIANFLSEHGVKHVFTVTGGGAMHLNDSLGHHKGLACIYNHHEQACAIAAEGYTRLSGRLSAVCVTSGPGGTNAITGVLGGWLDSIPMFIISGQVKRETTTASTDVPLRQLGDQEFQIVDCVNTMTKYAKMIWEPNEIAYHLEKAMYLCKNGRGGPVWIDVPLDVQAAIVETDELKHFDLKELEKQNVHEISESIAKEIIEKISNAKKPVIIAGSAIRLADSHDEFIELVNKLQIPVVTAWNAHDNIWDEHPLYCGRPGTVGTRGGNFVMENSDLILSLGCRLNIRQISYNYKNFSKNAYKIVVDIDKAELEKPTLSVDMPIHADVKDVINKLLNVNYENKNNEHKQWLNWCRRINLKYPACKKEFYKQKSPINPYVFMDRLFHNLEEYDSVICGNGSACVCSFQAASLKPHQRLFTNSGCASMGYGLPAAFGGSIAVGNDRRVICLDGDGSFQMNIQELQTIVYHQPNMKIFVLNNHGYHSIRQTQTNLFKPPLIGVSEENGISFPCCEKIADAYGLNFERIDNLENIEDKIIKVLSSDGPIICEVMLDQNQNFEPKLSSKVMPDGKIISPSIDDMFPFLDREEYEGNKFAMQYKV